MYMYMHTYVRTYVITMSFVQCIIVTLVHMSFVCTWYILYSTSLSVTVMLDTVVFCTVLESNLTVVESQGLAKIHIVPNIAFEDNVVCDFQTIPLTAKGLYPSLSVLPCLSYTRHMHCLELSNVCFWVISL